MANRVIVNSEELKDRLVAINRVVKVTKGGRTFTFAAIVVVGDVAGGAMRAVLDSVGIKDVLAKSKGSSNPHNLVKATILALSEMRDAKTIAQHRGISMEKVFRG